jgi:uncharacterized protein (TIGR02246 family)
VKRGARALVLLLSIWIAASPSGARADDVRAAIDAGNRDFVAAFLRGDAKAVAALYAEDAQVIPPGGAVASGRAAIAAHWQAAIESGVKDLKLATESVESDGDLACETGRVTLVAREGQATTQRYVVVWKREDGRWRLYRDIWN